MILSLPGIIRLCFPLQERDAVVCKLADKEGEMRLLQDRVVMLTKDNDIASGTNRTLIEQKELFEVLTAVLLLITTCLVINQWKPKLRSTSDAITRDRELVLS